MLWTVLTAIPPEEVWVPKDLVDTTYIPGRKTRWTLRPQFLKEEGLDEQERVYWTVGLLHNHKSTLEQCGLVNKEDVRRKNATPEYECNRCGQRAPDFVVSAKHQRHDRLRGTDPRIDRRGAVLATQKKYHQKES